MNDRLTLSMLTFTTIGSLLTAAGCVLVLKPDDRISIGRGTVLMGLGFLFFLSIFDLLNVLVLKTAIGQRVKKKYDLTIGEVLDISNKVVSAIQAAFCCFTGMVVCLWSCTRDLLHSSHFMSEAYAWFGAAYFFYDIWSMYKVHIFMNVKTKEPQNPLLTWKDNMEVDTKPMDKKKQLSTTFFAYCKNEPVILMHHLFIGGFGFLVIVYLRGGLGDCVFGFVYFMEFSTPFVSIRGILSRLKMKATLLYCVNGIAMLVSFFVCRILSMPYVCYLYSKMVGLSYFDAIRSLPTGCKISIAILLLPQFYWFYLMMAGAFKMFFVSPKSPKSPGMKNGSKPIHEKSS